MSATIVLIEYKGSEAQETMTRDQWSERAEQIAGLPGLRWKYWLQEVGEKVRGGVYFFEDAESASHAAALLTSSLEQAGATDVTQKMFEVDTDLSVITRGMS